jgi:Ser-tRNA(Ala) deacylase AlaX
MVNQTPFYIEKGGQIGDTGTLTFRGKMWENLEDTTWEVFSVMPDHSIPNCSIHHIRYKSLIPCPDCIKGEGEYFSQERMVELKVDREKRLAIERHHTATHLLQAALREILGKHVHQAGSLVTDQKLRFDFTHFEPVSPETLDEIEKKIQDWIFLNREIRIYETNFDAIPDGCIALFDGKYGEKVRVVEIPDISVELCGGCHVRASGEIEIFKILKESSIASGMRRIEAAAGPVARKWEQERCKKLKEDNEKENKEKSRKELLVHHCYPGKDIVDSFLGKKKSYQQGESCCWYQLPSPFSPPLDQAEQFPPDWDLRYLRELTTSLLLQLQNGIALCLYPASPKDHYSNRGLAGFWNLILHFSPVWVERGFVAERCLGEIMKGWKDAKWYKGKSNNFALGGTITMQFPPEEIGIDLSMFMEKSNADYNKMEGQCKEILKQAEEKIKSIFGLTPIP